MTKTAIDSLIGHNFRAKRLDGKVWRYFFAQRKIDDDPPIIACRIYDDFGRFTDDILMVRQSDFEKSEIVILP